MHDKEGNEMIRVDQKWSIHFPKLGMAFAKRYDEGNYDLDNIHFAMSQEIETLREKLEKLNKIIDELCEPF